MNFEELAKEVIELVGGSGNIQRASHCISRLRFDVKEMADVKEAEIKALDGVLGTNRVGSQFQVIVGHNVEKAFAEVEKLLPDIADPIFVDAGQEKGEKEERKKIKIGNFLMGLVGHMAGCVYPALSVFIVAGLVKALPTILGPGMLGVLSAESDLYTILSFIVDACFYFLPIFLGYSSAKHFQSDPYIGMILGAILIVPGFMALVTENQALSFFGIPIGMYNYSMTVLPIILIVAAESHLEKFLKKHIPEKLHMMFVPTIAVLIMSFVGLCFLAPLGQYLGKYLADFLYWLHDLLGAVGVGIMSAIYCPMIMTGMHHTVNMIRNTVFLQNGYENFVLVAFGPCLTATLGTALAVGLKTKKQDVRSVAFSGVFSMGICGISEPLIYGVLLQYPKAMIAYMLGGFVGGTYIGAMNVSGYGLLGANLLGLLRYSGGPVMDLVNGLIGCALAFVVSFVCIWILGYEKAQKKA